MMITNPSTSELSESTQSNCNKLRGTVPESGVSLCRIYMTESTNKADCSQFIDHMKEMNDDPNNAVEFTVRSTSYHKQRHMIKAKLNADAINTVSALFRYAHSTYVGIYTLQLIILSFYLHRFANHKKLNPS